MSIRLKIAICFKILESDAGIAARIALRTQQIIAHESGVPNTIDPLAGSYYVEALTDNMEKQAEEYFDKIAKIGGVVKGSERGIRVSGFY